MTERKSHWILGLVYINPDDSRLLVPLPCKIGLAVNFGNPRSVRFLAWIWPAFILSLLVAPIVAHPSYFANNLTPLFWVILADLAAVGIIRLNSSFAWADYRLVPMASFGLVAAGLGFALQAIVNGPLVLLWGPKSLSWMHHLVLAPVAALAQTFGKGIAVLLLLKARPVSQTRSVVRYGLLVGLGFTITEITSIFFSVAWAQLPLTSYLGAWERTSISMFHIYSAGLVALALGSKQKLPILMVVGIHAVTDFLAGISALLPFSIYVLETIFSLCAVLVWAAFLVFIRAGSSNELSRSGIQHDAAQDGESADAPSSPVS